MKFLIVQSAALAATILLPAAVQAATADNTMGVSATVTRTCTVTANALGFALVAEGAATTTSALVSVNCTAGSTSDAPSITVSDGENRNTLRHMIGGDSGTALIPYTISATLGGADLPAATEITLTDGGTGQSYSTTLHGSIANSSNYQIGTFSDTVTVTVTYGQ